MDGEYHVADANGLGPGMYVAACTGNGLSPGTWIVDDDQNGVGPGPWIVTGGQCWDMVVLGINGPN